MVRSKQEIREEVWKALEASGVTRFLGAQGRIPNFKGANLAAELARTLPVWKSSRVLKCNPDSPQRYLRLRALEEGKLIYMAIPRLREEKCFLEIDPSKVRGSLDFASSIRGAFSVGRKVTVEEMRDIDLIVCGSVAVNREGARLGKGGGFSDLEYALAVQAEKAGPETPILATAHSIQVVEEEIPLVAHDITLDYIVTPEEVIECPDGLPRPKGIYWELLPEEKIAEVPVLRGMRERVGEAA
jgi:5-formyltetrahydrofolate cyclo-ligase